MRHLPNRAPSVLTLALVAACGSTPAVDTGSAVTLAAAGSGNPTVALDPQSGAAYATWIEQRDGAYGVYVARIDGSGRSEPVRVNDVENDAAPHDQAPPQIAVGPDGAVYVVWQNNTEIPGRRFPASNLRFARSTDGARSFSPATYVNDDAAGLPSSHTFQDIAVAADGTIYVSWIDGRERSRAEAAQRASPAAGVASGHGGHGGSHGGHDAGLPGSDVRVARSTDGGLTFTTAVVVYRDVCPCCRTALAVSEDGVMAVAFRSAAANVRDILVVRSADQGATFSEPVRVHADGWVIDSCPHAGAALAFGADGRLHVAWYTGAEERQGLWYAVSEADGGFAEPAALQTGGWVPVSQVKLAVDDAGSAWIAWDDRRDAERQVVLAVADARGRLRAAPVREVGQSPAVAAGAAVLLAWQRDESAAARLLRPR